MLPNFEEITVDLNESETKLAYYVRLMFKPNQKAIKAKNIVLHLNFKKSQGYFENIRVDEPRVRKVINYICKNWMPNLIGTSKGYYLTNDVKELERAAATLQSRANENTRRSEVILSHLKALAGGG